MAKDKEGGNKEEWTDLDLLRFLDQEIENNRAKKHDTRSGFSVTTIDDEGGYSLSRQDIRVIMPIHRLVILLIPEKTKKGDEDRELLGKKIVNLVQFDGMRCSYIPDIDIPFGNLPLKKQRCAEVSIEEFKRLYESGRLYHGSGDHIKKWDEEINKANEKCKIIKGIYQQGRVEVRKKRDSTSEKDKERVKIYEDIFSRSVGHRSESQLIDEAAITAKCSPNTMRRALGFIK